MARREIRVIKDCVCQDQWRVMTTGAVMVVSSALMALVMTVVWVVCRVGYERRVRGVRACRRVSRFVHVGLCGRIIVMMVGTMMRMGRLTPTVPFVNGVPLDPDPDCDDLDNPREHGDCNDGVDNDGDQLVDAADPQCLSLMHSEVDLQGQPQVGP